MTYYPYPLTAKQAEVLDCIKQGMNISAIGRRMGISPKTVREHRWRGLAKLNGDTVTMRMDSRDIDRAEDIRASL